jgi:hypothetical protein
MRIFLRVLFEKGIRFEDLKIMVQDNPAFLLGI